MTTGTILTDKDLDRCTSFLNEVPYYVDYDLDHIHRACRNTEQAVLQSPEIQALRKDAERYRWLRDNSSVILDRHAWFKAESGTHIDTTMPSQRELDATIDAAMEQNL